MASREVVEVCGEARSSRPQNTEICVSAPDITVYLSTACELPLSSKVTIRTKGVGGVTG